MRLKLVKGIRILSFRLGQQGLRTTALWAADHLVRMITGANLRRLSEIAPGLHVGGQYRRRGWRQLRARGITAVVNLRSEWDDRARGIAPPRYLHLPTPDDGAPSLGDLRAGCAFIAEELARGGGVWVHCGAGVGRAATLAAAYLIATGLAPGHAWARIRAVRPFIRPSAAQVAQLERFAGAAGDG